MDWEWDGVEDENHYIEPDPDPEEDRYSVWSEDRGEYLSVFDVPRLVRWWRWLTFDYAYNVHGPLVRLRYDILRHFKPCEYCGKRGCGPYWFSNVCSDQCSKDLYALHCANGKKLHIQQSEHYTLCREWIWQERKAGTWIPDKNDAEFCMSCLAKAKGMKLYEYRRTLT